MLLIKSKSANHLPLQFGHIAIIVFKAERIQMLRTAPGILSLRLESLVRFTNTGQAKKDPPLKSCDDFVWNVRVATKKPLKNAQQVIVQFILFGLVKIRHLQAKDTVRYRWLH